MKKDRHIDWLATLNSTSHQPVVDRFSHFAPSNIALAKYWGKACEALKIPTNPSLSISLGTLGINATVEHAEQDGLSINGQIHEPQSVEFKRVFTWLSTFAEKRPCVHISTQSNIPIAAGLASSAAAFAALTLALNHYFGWHLTPQQLADMARLGSASAARSIFNGFVELIPTAHDECQTNQLNITWQEFRIGVITLSTSAKCMSSTKGMAHTQATSALFSAWPQFATESFQHIRQAIFDKHFSTLGELVEHNALTMHATMMAANPSLIYMQPESLAVLEQIRQLRKHGTEVYATLDAGANVKLIFQKKNLHKINSSFKEMQIIAPFA